MDPIQLYACSLGGLILLLLIFRTLRILGGRRQYWPTWIVRLVGHVHRKILFFLLKHVVYPRLFRRSRYWIILQSLYWGGTITCNFIKTHTLSDIAGRAGNLAVLNFVPLLLAGRLNLAADLLGLPFRSYLQLHGTLGIMTCVQSITHMALLIHQKGWSPKSPLQLYGLIALSAFSLSVALILIRRCMYELFIKMHYLLAVLALIALWRHVRPQRVFSQIYLLAGSCLFIALTALHWMTLVFRNVTHHRLGTYAEIYRSRDSQVAQAIIPVHRPFRPHAGMTVYLWMPGVSLFSPLYTHPFTIVWWETNEQGKATSISLLIERKEGFTKRLMRHQAKKFLTWIDGPYGERLDMTPYQNVLMVASGIGIAAQIPYIRELLDLHPKQIYVVWEVKDQGSLDWVYQWMDRLLIHDKDSYILRFGLYISFNSTDLEPESNSYHGRIWKVPGEIDPWTVANGFWNQPGRSLITVSANKQLREKFTDVVQKNMERVVDIVELTFQPGAKETRHNEGEFRF